MISDSSSGQVVSLPQRALPPPPSAQPSAAPPRVGTRHGAGAVLTDVLPDRPFDPAATGFVLAALAEGSGPVLWVRDRKSRLENGCIHGPGLRGFGLDRSVLHVTVSHPRDVLWAMEEGAGCAGLSGVVGEIHGAPSVLDFTATKRLALRAEASGVPVFLIRSGDPGTLSAARERWRIGALPSQPNPHDAMAPGAARWQAELFRARARPPGAWVAVHEPGAVGPADRLRLLSRSGDGQVAADQRAAADAAG